jgi:RES domain-containing protein
VSISIYRGDYTGPVFRQCRGKYATNTTPDSLVRGSLRDGGRFNPAGEFGALYVSLDTDTPIAELCRQVVRGGFPLATLFPRVMLRFDVNVSQVYDLTHRPTMQAAGLDLHDIIPGPGSADDAGHSVCQRVARDVYDRGFEAIRYPSATGAGENLAIFMKRLRPDSYVTLVRPWENIPMELVRQLLP